MMRYEESAFGGTSAFNLVTNDVSEKECVCGCCYAVCGKGTGFGFFRNILRNLFRLEQARFFPVA